MLNAKKNTFRSINFFFAMTIELARYKKAFLKVWAWQF